MKLKTFISAIMAGFMIGIGGTIYLSSSDKVTGAFLFTVGLLTICSFGFNLFTGKVGYVANGFSVIDCLIIWSGNLCGCLISGILVRYTRASVALAAVPLFQNKITMPLFHAFILGIFCGILMFIAVDHYKKNTGFSRYIGIMLCVPVFILSGFEHSIADMFYCILAISSVNEFLPAMLFLVSVSLGNAFGAIVFHKAILFISEETV